MSQAIGIDVGGTRIKGALIDTRTGAVLYQLITPTGDGESSNWQRAVLDTAEALTKQATESILGIGLSAPGLPAPDNKTIVCMPGRLQGLEGFDWSAYLGKPVRVLNDAHAALMAEARFGALKGVSHGLILTLGTGVGGGLLLNGHLYQGFFQMAGHLGHMTVNADSVQPDITNMPGSLEDAIGNATVGRRSFGRYQTTHELVDGYRQREPLATQVWLTSIRQLAVSIASLASAFSPEVVVLGGGIMQADRDLLEPLQTFLDLFEWRPAGKKTIIRKAYFEDWAGAIGAASFLLD
ncbi:ROK family protein [Spirosoma radiotolerans]|uniref:ROK family transcriptional regulator n=1 Tax=Spirosoma radiotolerans TaxID=1379870 RepID=A0A0E3V6E0_9BACT|nr:ROK family protein [Spirosoma radiotolerans]AKD54947.1 ROK family transcriptional regulator [Spirosoma radiotolerans]